MNKKLLSSLVMISVFALTGCGSSYVGDNIKQIILETAVNDVMPSAVTKKSSDLSDGDSAEKTFADVFTKDTSGLVAILKAIDTELSAEDKAVKIDAACLSLTGVDAKFAVPGETTTVDLKLTCKSKNTSTLSEDVILYSSKDKSFQAVKLLKEKASGKMEYIINSTDKEAGVFTAYIFYWTAADKMSYYKVARDSSKNLTVEYTDNAQPASAVTGNVHYGCGTKFSSKEANDYFTLTGFYRKNPVAAIGSTCPTDPAPIKGFAKSTFKAETKGDNSTGEKTVAVADVKNEPSSQTTVVTAVLAEATNVKSSQ